MMKLHVLVLQFYQEDESKFKISTKQKINIKDFQLQQKIIYLKIQLNLQSISNILSTKVNNLTKYAFNKLTNIKNQQKIYFIEQKIINLRTSQIISKINYFICNYQTKLLSNSFNILVFRSLIHSERQQRKHKKQIERKNSQMLRIHSKVEPNTRIPDLVCEIETLNGSLKTKKNKNKQLKKHKIQFQKNFNDFYMQMDQLLSSHEQLLKKK